MTDLTVSSVETKDELLEFISFPWEVYKDNSFWVPPLISERKEFLDAEENPFFEHARAEYFIARRGDKVVGTVAALTNDKYNEFQQTNVGFFGFFEVLEDAEAAERLLSTAVEWARKAGHDSIIGPVQFSTNDEVGLLVDGFDDRPRILMTYNPRRYLEYYESAGLQKVMDLLAYEINLKDFLKNVPEKLTRVLEKVRARKNFHIRTIRLKEYDAEIDRIKKIYNKSWEPNWGFVPMTDREFSKLAKNLKPLIDPKIALIVEKDGEAVGFALTMPDLNQPLHLAYPKPGTPEPVTMTKLLWHWKIRKRIDWIRVLALGVLPEFRGSGVDALMYLETVKAAARGGYKMAEGSWILENNVMMNRGIRSIGGKVYKTYRMFEKKL